MKQSELAKLKRTTWFNRTTKPLRPGVYERRYWGGTVMFSEWTGYNWLFADVTPKRAARRSDVSGMRLPWRGLAQDPSTR